MIFFDDLPFIFVVFRCCRLQLSNCMIFKPASIIDFIVAFVFSCPWFYYPLSITGCDLNANVEDRGYFENLARTDQDLNRILATFSDIASIFQNSHNEFITLSLNIQSIHAKFNQLYTIVSKLSSMGLYFGATCLQEIWLASDADLSLLQLPGYNIIHQGSKCTKHGGLLIYLSEMYFIWEICATILIFGKVCLSI